MIVVLGPNWIIFNLAIYRYDDCNSLAYVLIAIQQYVLEILFNFFLTSSPYPSSLSLEVCVLMLKKEDTREVIVTKSFG